MHTRTTTPHHEKLEHLESSLNSLETLLQKAGLSELYSYLKSSHATQTEISRDVVKEEDEILRKFRDPNEERVGGGGGGGQKTSTPQRRDLAIPIVYETESLISYDEAGSLHGYPSHGVRFRVWSDHDQRHFIPSVGMNLKELVGTVWVESPGGVPIQHHVRFQLSTGSSSVNPNTLLGIDIGFSVWDAYRGKMFVTFYDYESTIDPQGIHPNPTYIDELRDSRPYRRYDSIHRILTEDQVAAYQNKVEGIRLHMNLILYAERT